MPPIVLQNYTGLDLGIFQAHPAGVEAIAASQIARAQAAFPTPLSEVQGRNALVLGSTSMGYGSATAIALNAAGFENVYGLGFEGPPQIRTLKGVTSVGKSSTGWYLTRVLHNAGVLQRTYLADGFSDATRERVIGDLRREGIGIDLIVHSIATPKRTYNGTTWESVLRVIGDPVELTALKFNMQNDNPPVLASRVVDAATEAEIEATRRVMGGEDLELWIGAMHAAGVLNPGVVVTSRSYIGPPAFEALRRLYWEGSIGVGGKQDVDRAIKRLNVLLSSIGGRAFTEVDPAVVTVASAVIPAIAKYLAAYLAVVSGGVGKYLDPLDVAIKLVKRLYGDPALLAASLDNEGRLRLDDDEMKADLQAAIAAVWSENNQAGSPTEALTHGVDLYKKAYRNLFGWAVEGVDYSQAAEFDPSQPESVVNLLAKPSAADQTPVNPLDRFFSSMLARDTEPYVRREMVAGKPVYVMELVPNQIRTSQYSALVGHADASTLPAAFTFAAAFPAIIDAIKERLRGLSKKTVVHTREIIEMVKPIDPMEPVTIRVREKNARTQQGVTMVTVDRELVDKSGTVVAKGSTTLMLGLDLKIEEPKWEALPQGLEVVSEQAFDQAKIDAYRHSSGDHNPIHWNPDVIKSLEMPAPLAHGAFVMGVGGESLTGGYIAMFKSPVLAGETVRYYRQPNGKIAGYKLNPADASQGVLVIELTPKVART